LQTFKRKREKHLQDNPKTPLTDEHWKILLDCEAVNSDALQSVIVFKHQFFNIILYKPNNEKKT